jgi:hypothetical protein
MCKVNIMITNDFICEIHVSPTHKINQESYDLEQMWTFWVFLSNIFMRGFHFLFNPLYLHLKTCMHFNVVGLHCIMVKI